MAREDTEQLDQRIARIHARVLHLFDVPSVLADVAAELTRARATHPSWNSAHEAYAIILEELDEFWSEVKRKRSDRCPADMRAELVQIAACACRAVIDLEL